MRHDRRHVLASLEPGGALRACGLSLPKCFLAFLLLCLVGALAVAAPAAQAAPTHVSGTISQDTTWTLSGSPYVLDGNVTVSSGVTLTIEAGVVVKSSWRRLTVYGALDAQGTALAPITFTSLKDDTVAGDTNGDGSASTPAKGDWTGLAFWSGGSGSLEHIALRWAGAGWRTPAIMLGSGSPTLSLTDLQIAHSKDAAIKTWDGSSTLTVSDCTLDDNDGVGIIVTQPQQPVAISGSTIRDGGSYAIDLTATTSAASLSNLSLSGNTITGNDKNAVAVNGTARSDWQLPGYPEADEACYVTTGTLSVNSGATLTLDPGAVVKSGGSYSLSVSGNSDRPGHRPEADPPSPASRTPASPATATATALPQRRPRATGPASRSAPVPAALSTTSPCAGRAQARRVPPSSSAAMPLSASRTRRSPTTRAPASTPRMTRAPSR